MMCYYHLDTFQVCIRNLEVTVHRVEIRLGAQWQNFT